MKKSSRGFTLLELIIVCALIGIMLVVSVPALHSAFVDDQLKAACRKIIGLVGGVRELAVRENQPYFLFIDRNENSIWYEKDTESEDEEKVEGRKIINLPDGIRVSEIWTRSEGEYSDDQNRIWINRKGYMDQTVMHLTDDNSNIISLHFSPFMDSVRLYDRYTNPD